MVATLKEQFESAEKETKDEIEEKLNKCEKQLELYDSQKAINRILSDLSNSTDGEIQEAIFNTISDKNFSKAEFALDLLYFDELKPPKYINDGLIWLSNTLEKHNKGV